MLHQKFKKPQAIKSPKPAFLRRIAAVLALAVLGVALVFAVPDMRAIAQSIIESLFPVAESNQVQYPDEGLFSSVVGSTIAVSSLQGAERAVTFPIKIPEVPDELSLREYLVRPDANVSILFYGTYPLTMRRQPPGEAAVLIAQQPLEDAEEVGIFGDQGLQSTLAPEAERHPITFGPDDAYEGQWVRGLWVPTSSEPEQDGTFTYVWQEVPVYRLRWQDESYIYEISWYLLSEDRNDLTETPINQSIVDDLIQIAESIMSGGVDNDTQFYDTFESAQADVPFAIALPDRGLLVDYAYESYSYNADIQTAYVQYFEGEFRNNRRDGNAVTIQQQPLSEIESGVIFGQQGALAAVGPDANIQLYTFGEGVNGAPYEGQWVKGMWTQNENAAIEADYIWRSEFPVYRLRWQDETYIYEVQFFGRQYESALDFVLNIAASMMSDGEYDATQFTLQEGSVLDNFQARYFDTTDELEEIVDIDIMDLSFLPETYVMEQAVYDVEGRTAIVVYALQYANFDAIRPDSGLSFKQQRLEDTDALGTFGDTSPLAAIGPAAEIQPIQIGDFQAEWVQGSWSININEGENKFNWLNNVPVYHMRWQDETYIYEMNFWFNVDQSGIEDVMHNMAASIAESMAAESE